MLGIYHWPWYRGEIWVNKTKLSKNPAFFVQNSISTAGHRKKSTKPLLLMDKKKIPYATLYLWSQHNHGCVCTFKSVLKLGQKKETEHGLNVSFFPPFFFFQLSTKSMIGKTKNCHNYCNSSHGEWWQQVGGGGESGSGVYTQMQLSLPYKHCVNLHMFPHTCL